MFQRNKCFCWCILEPKEKVLKFQKIFENCQLRVCYIQSPQCQTLLVSVVFFLIYFATLSLVFILKKKNKVWNHILEMNPQPPTGEEFLRSSTRKIITVLSTLLGKLFFAWHFILNKGILLCLTISYQKPFVFSFLCFFKYVL